MHNDADANLDRRLPKQHGAFSRQQALDAGFAERAIDRRLANGTWRRLDQSVYGHPAYDHTWEQRCVAAVLGERHAVLDGATAAAIYEVPGFAKGAVRITVPPGKPHRSSLARVRRSMLIDPCVHRGFRVNAVPFVLVELASAIGRVRLERATEDAVLLGLTTMDLLVGWTEALSGSRRPGLGQLRAIVQERADGFVPPASELEALLFSALACPDIPTIVRQAPFPWSPGGAERVDAFIPQWGILLEADGRRWHARLQTMESDRRRDQEAVRRGFQPLRFGWRDLQDDPRRVRDIVVETGRRRAHLAVA
jgi:hypothetical protein